jgi:hypothetical protein
MPEILCVVQVCLEGELNKQTVKLNLSRGKQAAGDLIPWTMSQQFQDDDFASLSGARIVRIATHPDYQRVRPHHSQTIATKFGNADVITHTHTHTHTQCNARRWAMVVALWTC